MSGRDDYLFDFTTGGMSVVLALIFDKLARGIGNFAGGDSDGLSAAVGLLTNAAILLVLVSVLTTLSFAHREMAVAYRRTYFMADLVGALLLYVAVECTHRAAFEGGQRVQSMVFGLSALALTFACLILRAWILSVRLSEPERHTAGRKILYVVCFHLLGVVLSAIAISLLAAGYAVSSIPLLLCATGAVAGAVVYLTLFWPWLRPPVEHRDGPTPT